MIPMETIPDLLGWDEPDGLVTAYAAYTELLSRRLGEAIALAMRADRARGTELEREIAALPDRALSTMLTAPETSHHLFWRAPLDPLGAAEFLMEAARVERSRLDPTIDPERPMWSALGDLMIAPGGERYEAPLLAGSIPVDLIGPRLDAVAGVSGPGGILDEASRQRALEVAGRAMAMIRDTHPLVADFVSGFTTVLALRRDTRVPGAFTSRSPEKRIGLSLLANPDLPSVDDVEIAEALVHEAMHTLLDIDETIRRLDRPREEHWVKENRLYDGELRTISPWTSNPLPLPTYIHACFVWYGLLRFWGSVYGLGAFDQARVRARMEKAVIGFLGAPLLEQASEHADAIDPRLRQGIERMQESVQAVFA